MDETAKTWVPRVSSFLLLAACLAACGGAPSSAPRDDTGSFVTGSESQALTGSISYRGDFNQPDGGPIYFARVNHTFQFVKGANLVDEEVTQVLMGVTTSDYKLDANVAVAVDPKNFPNPRVTITVTGFDGSPVEGCDVQPWGTSYMANCKIYVPWDPALAYRMVAEHLDYKSYRFSLINDVTGEVILSKDFTSYDTWQHFRSPYYWWTHYGEVCTNPNRMVLKVRTKGSGVVLQPKIPSSQAQGPCPVHENLQENDSLRIGFW